MNRRLFIQRTLVAGGGLVLSFKTNFLFGFNRQKTVTGKVTANGKGLAGVLVSDGFNFAKTDASGVYNLATGSKSEFAFVVIPAGYEFPHENRLAKFYAKLDGGNLDFELKPLPKSDDQHSFIIWADPQVKNVKDVGQMMATSVPDVQKLVREMPADTILHGIGVGDLVWDNHELFVSYNEAVSKMDVTFFQCLGNHDMDYRQGGDETSDRTFKAHYGPTYYSFNRGKAHYVVIDNVRYLGVERTYDGYITEEQLEWLEKDLQHVSKDTLLIINLHIPVHNHTKNNKELYRLIRSYNDVHIMSGHTHYNQNVQIAKQIMEHNHGAVCGGWWTGPICSDGTPRGYGVYEVKGNKLSWHYRATGHDKNYQLSLHTDEQKTSVVANVWNWDEKWKVEYWLDGQYKGVLKNKTGFDPQAVKLYLGKELPVKRPFVEPTETDHLFIASIGAENKNIKVVATDRFGTKYESSLDLI